MKNCIKCNEEISDDAQFCHHCGASQSKEQLQESHTKAFPITARAFMRIFRPSFFGGLEKLNIGIGSVMSLVLDYLSLSSDISDSEIDEMNLAFDMMLNNADREYDLSNGNQRKELDEYKVDASNRAKVDNEDDRYEIITERIEKIISTYQTSGYVSVKMIAATWLFALLSALGGNYSKQEKKLFGKMKRLFPISREQVEEIFEMQEIYSFIGGKENIKNFMGYNDDCRKSEWRKNFLRRCCTGNVGNISKEKYGHFYGSVMSTLYEVITQVNQIENDANANEETELQVILLPEDFDFYAHVEKTAQKLCDYEYKIGELEMSEGKYSDIANQIEDITKQEKELLAVLIGFHYERY